MKKIYIGCDVGKGGAFVGIDESSNIVIKSVIPKIGDNVDIQGIVNLLSFDPKEFKVYVAIEDVHSIYGTSAKSNFSFGWIKGLKTGIIATLGLTYMLVQPKTWQKYVWSPTDVVKKGTKTDTKKTSLTAAKRLFPHENFLATERSKVPHDGIVDAVLIALYCKNYFN